MSFRERYDGERQSRRAQEERQLDSPLCALFQLTPLLALEAVRRLISPYRAFPCVSTRFQIAGSSRVLLDP